MLEGFVHAAESAAVARPRHRSAPRARTKNTRSSSGPKSLPSVFGASSLSLMRTDEIVSLMGHAWSLLGVPEEADADAVVMDRHVAIHLRSVSVRDAFGLPIAITWDLTPTERARLLAATDDAADGNAALAPSNEPHADVAVASFQARFEHEACVDSQRTIAVRCERCGHKVLGAASARFDRVSMGERVERLKLAMLNVLRHHTCVARA